MFDQNALTSLQALLAKDTDKLSESTINAVIIPEGTKVASLEHLEENPALFKSHFKTHSLDDFIEYSNKNANMTSQTYIDADNASAITIIDHGNETTPEWGYHKASINLKRTPAFSALLEMQDRKSKQLTLIDFLSDWEENIQFFDESDDVIDFKTALNRIRRLTIKSNQSAEFEQGDFKSNKSAMETVEIQSGNDNLPAYFIFKTPPHDLFEERQLKCQIRASSNDSELLIAYRIIALEAQKDEVAKEFKAKINDGMSDATIYLGSVSHRD